MERDWRTFSGVNSALRRAADYSMQAMTLIMHNNAALGAGYAAYIEKDLRQAAAELGFDLVKREPAKQQEAA